MDDYKVNLGSGQTNVPYLLSKLDANAYWQGTMVNVKDDLWKSASLNHSGILIPLSLSSNKSFHDEIFHETRGTKKKGPALGRH